MAQPRMTTDSFSREMSWGKGTRCALSHCDRAPKETCSSARGCSCSGVKWLVSVTSGNAIERPISTSCDGGEDRDLVLGTDRAIELVAHQDVSVEEEAMHVAHAAVAIEQHLRKLRADVAQHLDALGHRRRRD